MNTQKQMPRGCGFLLTPVGTETIFTPEDFTADQRTFAKTAEDFMEKEIWPDVEHLEKLEPGLMVAKLKKAGELGLLMIDVPEEYGGIALDKTTSMLCSEKFATYPSFSVSHGAHTGIGTLPLLFFGNHEQKSRYLPRLATGELIAAYALTEPGSGSDALGARTTATKTTRDGRDGYALNGTKMWITNAGFADLFTVFAKVDGKHFTAFLVERGYAGFSTGAEEKKMGLKGSSTRMLILEDVFVPEENVLGEIGRGHKIAFNILNFGRFKLGVGACGGAKKSVEVAAKYAHERKQFGVAISSFGAIRQKFADMAVSIYALESMCYRVAGYMDTAIGVLDSSSPTYVQQMMDAIEDFAVEDSILKVYGSECADNVVDECVQVHGGYGYSAEYPAERAYRDSRINRIFEGTNEVNRMLIPGVLLRRVMKGEIPMFELVGRAQATIAERVKAPAPAAAGLEREMFLAERAKELCAIVTQRAAMRHMADLKDQQELLLALADMLTFVYGIDSTVARVKQAADAGKAQPVHFALAQVFTAESYAALISIARQLTPSICDAAELEDATAEVAAFDYTAATDVIGLKRVVADATLAMTRWSL
jgi:alkylation response protein AidB-like acyl-CoA dehydrogenase